MPRMPAPRGMFFTGDRRENKTMIFYPGKNNNALNTRPFAPESITDCAMVNPHYRVDLAPGTRYIIDSGAFQERDMLARLQPWQALDRQLRLEAQIEYGGHGGPAEAIVTYDMLVGVDEALVDGKRKKVRGTEESAAPAVAETLRSARYYATQVPRVRGAIAYAAQGATVAQYLACVDALLPLMRPGVDWMAFGGFCIIGRVPSLKPLFYAVLDAALPRCRAAGITRAHLLGVTVADAITVAAGAERRYGVALSTDSTGPEQCAVFGRGYTANGRQTELGLRKQDKYVAYHPCDLAHQNIETYTQWIATLDGKGGKEDI